VNVSVPTSNAPPTAPTTYTTAVFTANVWEATLTSTGSMVTGVARTPTSVNFYCWSPENGSASATGPLSNQDVRAVSIFGPTGATRVWRYDGAVWVRR
jgi:hypothetical protein